MALNTTFMYQQPEFERKISIHRPPGEGNRKREALGHLLAGGIPVNKNQLDQIKKEIKSGRLLEDRCALISETKKDPGLLIHCAKNIRSLSKNGDHPIDLFEELQILEDQKIEHLFAVSEREVSTHHLAKANIMQAASITRSIISSTAAESLSSTLNINSNNAFTASLFSQLGLMLISWNYPEIYTRAMHNNKRYGTDIEAQLADQLGFKSQEIGEQLAKEWGMPTDVLISLREGTASKVTDSESIGLREICIVSDLYAQTKDPAHFPKALSKWEQNKKSFESVFGVDFTAQIDKRIIEPLSSYADLNPFKRLKVTKDILSDTVPQPAAPTEQINIYAKRCPSDIRQAFEQVYSLIDSTTVSVDAIRVLVEKVFPLCGFSLGCLYLLTRDEKFLKPAMRFGPASLSAYKSYRLSEDNPIGASLFLNFPSKSAGIGILGGTKERILANLDSDYHSGVLYLELSEDLANNQAAEPILLFQAIRKALSDSLGSASSKTTTH